MTQMERITKAKALIIFNEIDKGESFDCVSWAVFVNGLKSDGLISDWQYKSWKKMCSGVDSPVK